MDGWVGLSVSSHTLGRDDVAGHSNQHGDGEALARPFVSQQQLGLVVARPRVSRFDDNVGGETRSASRPNKSREHAVLLFGMMGRGVTDPVNMDSRLGERGGSRTGRRKLVWGRKCHF